MRKICRNIIKIARAIALLMAVLFVLQVLNTALFYHTHKVGDNRYISHAHPFKKSQDSTPLKNHSHTDLQFISLENLKLIFFVFFVTFALLTLKKVLGKLVCKVPVTRRYVLLAARDRAPPVL